MGSMTILSESAMVVHCDHELTIKILNISDPFQISVLSTFGQDVIRTYNLATTKERNSLYVHQLLSATKSKLVWLNISDYYDVYVIDELALEGRKYSLKDFVCCNLLTFHSTAGSIFLYAGEEDGSFLLARTTFIRWYIHNPTPTTTALSTGKFSVLQIKSPSVSKQCQMSY